MACCRMTITSFKPLPEPIFTYRQRLWSCPVYSIDQYHKSYNAPVPYPTMHHSEQKWAHFCSEWCIVGYGTDALWDLLIRSIVGYFTGNAQLNPKLCSQCHKHWLLCHATKKVMLSKVLPILHVKYNAMDLCQYCIRITLAIWLLMNGFQIRNSSSYFSYIKVCKFSETLQ